MARPPRTPTNQVFLRGHPRAIPHQNALTSITFPGGTHQYFTYDSEGRLAGTSNDGGAAPVVRLRTGTSQRHRRHRRHVAPVLQRAGPGREEHRPAGQRHPQHVRRQLQPDEVTNALGESETYTYNSAGEVTSSTDFLGNTTYFAYSGPFNELASMTDANGNTTSYPTARPATCSARPMPTARPIVHLRPGGNATSFLNANGQPIQYTYNAAGQITTRVLLRRLAVHLHLRRPGQPAHGHRLHRHDHVHLRSRRPSCSRMSPIPTACP